MLAKLSDYTKLSSCLLVTAKLVVRASTSKSEDRHWYGGVTYPPHPIHWSQKVFISTMKRPKSNGLHPLASGKFYESLLEIGSLTYTYMYLQNIRQTEAVVSVCGQ